MSNNLILKLCLVLSLCAFCPLQLQAAPFEDASIPVDPLDFPSYPHDGPAPQAAPKQEALQSTVGEQPGEKQGRGFFKRQETAEPGKSFFRKRHGPANETANFQAPPKQIALLLPLSGKHANAAKAVREGFLAAYYDTPEATGASKPTVRVYDTLKGNHITQIYQQAVDDGAELIVGPLAKEEVAQLSTLSSQSMTIPILALNQSPPDKTSLKLIQFALAPEEEAAQMAFRAFLKGYRTTSIIVPDNDWGQRVAKAFQAQWKHQGGKIMRTVFVDPMQDQSASVRRLLDIDKLTYDPETKKPILKEKDIDVILMAAPPELARQWKPLFDFYYAEDVPVFATSSIYAGVPDPKRDRDMNGVIFCDMPSLIHPEMGSKLFPTQNSGSEADPSEENLRLFALGVDAYRVSLQLNQLTTEARSRFAGFTGELSLDNQYRIRRKLSCAKFKDGAPTPLQ